MGPRTRVKEMIKNETGREDTVLLEERERESIASTKKMMVSFVRQVDLTPKECSIPSVSR